MARMLQMKEVEAFPMHPSNPRNLSAIALAKAGPPSPGLRQTSRRTEGGVLRVEGESVRWGGVFMGFRSDEGSYAEATADRGSTFANVLVQTVKTVNGK